MDQNGTRYLIRLLKRIRTRNLVDDVVVAHHDQLRLIAESEHLHKFLARFEETNEALSTDKISGLVPRSDWNPSDSVLIDDSKLNYAALVAKVDLKPLRPSQPQLHDKKCNEDHLYFQ